jgi:hypothetical protein
MTDNTIPAGLFDSTATFDDVAAILPVIDAPTTKHVGHIRFENAISPRGREEWGYNTWTDYNRDLNERYPWNNTRIIECPCTCTH